MGYHLCRTLSVLVLAGVALVGCNNTPDKPKVLGSGGPPLPGSGGVANQGVNPQFPGGQQPFPLNQKQGQVPSLGGNPSITSPLGNAPTGGLTPNPTGGLTPSQGFVPTASGPSIPTTPTFQPLPPTGTPSRDIRTTATDFATTPPSPGQIQPPTMPKEFLNNNRP